MIKTKTSHKPPRNKKAIRPPAMNTLGDFIKTAKNKINEQVGNILLSRPHDIVAAIKADHEGLRNFIDTLKDADKKITERRSAYKQFAALLKSHTLAEEHAVYSTSIRLTGHEMHVKITEGYVEHKMADELMNEIERTKNPLQWTAHVNVLAEIVEHHLKEEEDDLLPLIRKKATAKVDEKMLTKYLELRDQSQRPTSKRNAGVLKGKRLRRSKTTKH